MGRPKTCNPCCEGGAGSSSSSSSRYSGSTVPCLTRCIDSVAPAQWTVTISGITAGSCIAGYCEAANRTWTLSPSGVCQWGETISTGFSCQLDTQIRCLVSLGSTAIGVTLIKLPTTGITWALWQKTISQPYDCLVPHTLDQVITASSICATYPSSVIIVPS